MARANFEFFAGLRAGAVRESGGRESGATLARIAAGDLGYAWSTHDERIVWTGDATALFGVDDAAMRAPSVHAMRSLVHPQDLPALLAAVHDALLQKGSFTTLYRLRLPDGAFRWVRDSGAVEAAEDGSTLVRGALRRHEPVAAGPWNGDIDPAPPALARFIAAQPEGASGLVVAAAIDHLDVIAEAFGHAVAEDVVATAIQRCFTIEGTAQQTLIRIGHGIFAFAMKGADEGALAAGLDALRQAVRAETIETPLGHFHISLSIGAAPFMGAAAAGWLLTHAEAALAQARSRGRDRCILAATAPGGAAASRTLVMRAEQVLTALGADTAFFAFQPVVDRFGKAVFHECLLRLRGEDGALVPAGEFIPAVETLGLHAAVDAHVIARVIDELAAYPALRLSCNVSSLSLAEPGFRAEIEARVARAPREAPRLIIEITETAALPEDREIVACLSRLRAAGVRLALDDFGAGFTSLRHLTVLPLDIVKLDGKLVRGMGESARSAAIVRSVIELAAQFGFALVAEGIEYGAEAEALRRLGVAYLQGYHCGRPAVDPPWRSGEAPRVAAASVA